MSSLIVRRRICRKLTNYNANLEFHRSERDQFKNIITTALETPKILEDKFSAELVDSDRALQDLTNAPTSTIIRKIKQEANAETRDTFGKIHSETLVIIGPQF